MQGALIEQVIYNLIDNADKFASGRTPVRIEVRRAPDKKRAWGRKRMTKSLQELSDLFEIQQLPVAYANAIDTHDWDALDRVFTPDAFIDYRKMGGPDGRYPEIKQRVGHYVDIQPMPTCLRNHAMLEEIKAGKGPIYMHTQHVLDTKEKEELGWEDFLDMTIGQAVVWASALSYLGVGTPPPAPEWGAMLADGRTYLQTAPWMSTFPGLAIVVLATAVTVLGRAVRRRGTAR